MEFITGYILNHFFGLAANLHSDYILTAQKDRQTAQFLEAHQAREALKSWRSIDEDVRMACLKLADQHEQLWVSPAQIKLRPLLRDPGFHQDFVEWLHVGAIEEGEPVKMRITQKMEALLSTAEISEGFCTTISLTPWIRWSLQMMFFRDGDLSSVFVFFEARLLKAGVWLRKLQGSIHQNFNRLHLTHTAARH
jgi:hypothetical protein